MTKSQSIEFFRFQGDEEAHVRIVIEDFAGKDMKRDHATLGKSSGRGCIRFVGLYP